MGHSLIKGQFVQCYTYADGCDDIGFLALQTDEDSYEWLIFSVSFARYRADKTERVLTQHSTYEGDDIEDHLQSLGQTL